MLQNPEYLGPSKTDRSATPVHAVATSDTELVITLDTPNSLILETLASVNGYAITTMQRAFCSQWDPAIDSTAERALLTKVMAPGQKLWIGIVVVDQTLTPTALL